MNIMSDEALMRVTIIEARKSKEPVRCGTVITENGKIIAQTFNSQRESHDATAHSEIKAIRQAGKAIKDKNLKDCIMYSTCEPCSMRMSAIMLAKIKKLYYGISLDEVPKNKTVNIASVKIIKHSKHSLDVVNNFLHEECKQILH